MPLTRMEQYLREHRVPYRTQHHAPAFTAQEVAAVTHVPGREMAKSVMVKIDNRLAMVVLPASERINLGRLREATGAEESRLASEEEFADKVVGQKVMPFRIEDEARKIDGTNFVVDQMFREFAVRDGLLVTGQQQYSGAAAARLVIEALGR